MLQKTESDIERWNGGSKSFSFVSWICRRSSHKLPVFLIPQTPRSFDVFKEVEVSGTDLDRGGKKIAERISIADWCAWDVNGVRCSASWPKLETVTDHSKINRSPPSWTFKAAQYEWINTNPIHTSSTQSSSTCAYFRIRYNLNICKIYITNSHWEAPICIEIN